MVGTGNHETAESYLGRAQRMFEQEARGAHAAGDFNLCIRRCQDSVELALKGLFKQIGIEYPKVHDVGEVLARELPGKKPGVSREDVAKVREISKELAKKREPSFYNEEIYHKEDAEAALRDGRFVLNWVEAIVKES